MNNAIFMIIALTAGLFLGAIFFVGLWWTIRAGFTSPHPALLFLSSAVIRMGIVITGIYFVSDGRWQRLVACLAGFMIARLAVTWLTRVPRKDEQHAP